MFYPIQRCKSAFHWILYSRSWKKRDRWAKKGRIHWIFSNGDPFNRNKPAILLDDFQWGLKHRLPATVRLPLTASLGRQILHAPLSAGGRTAAGHRRHMTRLDAHDCYSFTVST